MGSTVIAGVLRWLRAVHSIGTGLLFARLSLTFFEDFHPRFVGAGDLLEGPQSLQGSTTWSASWTSSTVAPAFAAPSRAAVTMRKVLPSRLGLPTSPSTLPFPAIAALLSGHASPLPPGAGNPGRSGQPSYPICQRLSWPMTGLSVPCADRPVETKVRREGSLAR